MRPRSLGVVLVLMVAISPIAALPLAATTAQSEAGRFLTGPNDGEPEDIAVSFLQERATAEGLSASDVAELAVTSSATSAHTGVTHVNLNQRFEGLEVFGAHSTVSVTADGSVAFFGGDLVRDLRPATAESPDLEATEAVEAAADALDLEEPANLRVLRRSADDAQETVVSGGGISDEPIPARLGWQPTDAGLRLAWQLVIDDSSDSHLWNATVDAETGELLDVDDWTTSDSVEDLASTLGRAGSATTDSDFVVAPRDRAPDGSSYLTYEIPKNDPNDGPRTVVVEPAEATASPFGWHDTDGVPGPEFTITRGNNVHAYTDRDANNVEDPGSEPDGGPSLNFNSPLDLTEDPLNYTDAAVTNLFYFCNVIHDVTYLYGFTEPFGNFQVNNYGRGGAGGDDVRCESQDGGGTNNANFSTPAVDGGRPRMQMFLWPGTQFGLPSMVTIGSGDDAVSFQAHFARFTPSATNAGVTGPVVLVNDGVGTVTDGCTAYELPAGAIALVDNSGTCNHRVRVANAEAAGAQALIVAHSTTAAAPILSGSMALPQAVIPAVSVTQANGNAIKAALPAVGRVHRNPNRPPMRDSSFRNETILHEYGHGVSLRLTGGPTTNCLSGQEQMGEGWSDFLAINMMLDPRLDDPEGARGYGQYALFADSRTGPGFRVQTYSRNMDLNWFTYDRIKTGAWNGGSIAAPHGIGWGWASVLWDMTWDLIEKDGRIGNIYDGWSAGGNNLAMQLVLDGLKYQGCGPGFVVGRDAIIQADQLLTGGDNECMLWTSFARRGLGASAVQGTTNRDDNAEAFDVPAQCRAPGRGFVGPQFSSAGLNTRTAGAAAPIQLDLGGNRGPSPLKPSHSPASQEIDCTTLQPLQFATTFPTDNAGESTLSYSTSLQRYQYVWKTSEDWAGTCRQLIIVLRDGTQHRANFRFVEPDPE